MGRRRSRAGGARLQLGPAALLSVQAYLRSAAAEGRDRVVAGCFDVFFSRERAAPPSNYAIPRDGAEPSPADVAALVAAFERARRLPRVEFLPAAAPAVEPALLAQGFEVELRTTVMTCERAGLATVPAPPGVRLEALGARSALEDVDAMLRIQAEAFGDVHEPLRRPPLWLGHFIAVLARADGVPAGGGMCLRVAGGTTELVGIAVTGRHRRRGIAAALTAELARRAFAAGAHTAFLTPGDQGATRVYARAGFRPVDVMLHLRRPPATPPAAPR